VTGQPDPVAEIGSSATGSVAIAIRGLSKSFGKRAGDRGEQALNDVDLDVAEGEFLVLLGPSGCGKTTLLRSIAGLETPDEGSITIDGAAMFDSERGIDADAGTRPVNMIFQSYALWPHMTAARNVAFPLKCAGVPRKEIGPRVQEILERVGIGQLGDRYPSQMSGGQQQRLALARVLVLEERIVLFDEPLSNVDAQVREKLRLELIKMQRRLGFTAIYVTHDQSEAMELADRIAVMSKGRIAQLGDPRDLYDNPADIDVARFLGQSNELAIVVERFDEATRQVVGRSEVGTVTAAWIPRRDTRPPSPDEQFVVFGRPGDFAVVSDDGDASRAAALDGLNRWPGQIEASRFVGTHTELVAKVGETELRCWASDGSELVDGQAVTVVVPADRLQAIRGT
jgi:iron(III) transport system ATP-binding protein